MDRDAAALRLFVDDGHKVGPPGGLAGWRGGPIFHLLLQVMLAQSFAKNMGLYGEKFSDLSCFRIYSEKDLFMGFVISPPAQARGRVR